VGLGAGYPKGELPREGAGLSSHWGERLTRVRAAAAVFAVLCIAVVIGSRHAMVARGSTPAPKTVPQVAQFLAHSANAVAAPAPVLPSGFHDTVAFSGLTAPTAVRFSPDGRVFVAEKSGLLIEYNSLTDPTPTTVADFSAETDDFDDRGLLGLALDPNFPATPYVYLLYTYDAPPGQTAPVWNDACPTPPGPITDGCVVTGRLVRIKVSGDTAAGTPTTMVGSPTTLISDQWCQQFPSHSIGDLNFGADGELYVSAGDGASYTTVDWGQFGGSPLSPTQANPCDDPPAGIGVAESLPTSEGGALRSQSARRAAGEPVSLDGTILRVDPATGAPAPGNPFAAPTDPSPPTDPSSSTDNKQRIVAYGLRNPFRFTFRPGTNELWIGNVGWNTWEAIDVDTNPAAAPAKNFGWPCYEGPTEVSAYATADLCSSLYADGTVTGPYYAYNHDAQVVPGESCPLGSSSITGLAFYNGGTYPSSYNGALFFADYSRNCIWAMLPGSNGLPDPATIQTFVAGAGHPVDLEIGPGGDLFYVDLDEGQIHRITYTTPSSTSPPAPSPAPSPTPIHPPIPAPVPRITIPTIARVSGDTAKLSLRCVGKVKCTGTLMIQSRPALPATTATKSKQQSQITYASVVFSIPAGKTRSVTIKLSKRGKDAVAAGHSLKAYANARFSAGRSESSKITLNWGKPRRPIPWWRRELGW
jgi:glucose/arabinose dehydrogenase